MKNRIHQHQKFDPASGADEVVRFLHWANKHGRHRGLKVWRGLERGDSASPLTGGSPVKPAFEVNASIKTLPPDPPWIISIHIRISPKSPRIR